jgi:nicotinate phosphoribosyltransferase
MEVYTRKSPFPDSNWLVLCGVYEVAKLLEGIPVDVDSMEEGEVFLTGGDSALYEPVMQITGRYQTFAKYENPILGFLCQASGVCTKAARLSLAARGKTVISFGTRRVHPALAPMIERSSFIGGMNSVSNVLGAKLLGMEPSGTMPHAFILCVGDEVKAWKLFNEALPRNVPRIALIDTFSDEKFAAIRAIEALGRDLYGVRLDTPSSRRGDLKKIVEEVRWELSHRGGRNVKIFVSGGLDEKEVSDLRDVVDGFGVGTSLSAAPVIDFGGKIVEISDGRGKEIPISKRGDLSGRKRVFRDIRNFSDIVTLKNGITTRATTKYTSLLRPLLRDGKIVRRFLSPEELRERTANLVRRVSRTTPSLLWN